MVKISKRYPPHDIAISLRHKNVCICTDVLVAEEDEEGDVIQRRKMHRTTLDVNRPAFERTLQELLGERRASKVIALLETEESERKS